MWNGKPFNGTKIALLCHDRLVVYLRDDKLGIPFPGKWDLPGGGRERDESPVECAIREVVEEFGLHIAAERVRSLECHPGSSAQGLDSYFCVADVSQREIDAIEFGDEGQRWTLMTVSEFLAHDSAVPHLQHRLRAHWQQR